MPVPVNERIAEENRGKPEALLQEPWLTPSHIEAVASLAGQPGELTQAAIGEFTRGILIKFATDDYNKHKLFISRELTPEQKAIKSLWVARAEYNDKRRSA